MSQTKNIEAANGLRLGRIEGEIQDITKQIGEARKGYDLVALDLLDAPADARTQAALDSIDAEVAALETRKTRLEAALRHAAELESDASRTAAAAARAAKSIATCKASAARLAIARDIEKTVEHLGDLLKTWGDTGAAIQSDAVDAFRFAYPDKYPGASSEKVSQMVMSLMPIARGDDRALQAALAQALFDAGIGRGVGIGLHGYIDIRPPRTTMSVFDAAENGHLKMVGILERVCLPTTAKAGK